MDGPDVLIAKPHVSIQHSTAGLRLRVSEWVGGGGDYVERADFTIPPEQVADFIQQVVQSGTYVLSSTALAIQAGDCPTCHNHRLVWVTRHGRETSINCPDCRPAYDRLVPFAGAPERGEPVRLGEEVKG